MRGYIGELIRSDAAPDVRVKGKIFQNGFQTIAQFNNFLDAHLVNGSVDAQLKTHQSREWETKTFQALFVACWLHHPVEKGTYMINLHSIGPRPQQAISNACQKNLKPRRSSHLGGSGYSASRGWHFLLGYNELLIQIEQTNGIPHLMLKAEGHTTDISQLPSHLRSWWHKKRTGKGLVANKDLEQYASDNNKIESRAAENYDKGFEKVVKFVGLSGKMVTVREMICALFFKLRISVEGRIRDLDFFASKENKQIGEYLQLFVRRASNPEDPIKVRLDSDRFKVSHKKFWTKVRFSQKVLSDLSDLSQSLISDGNQIMPRVYREIRVTPTLIDESLVTFRSYERTGGPVISQGVEFASQTEMDAVTDLVPIAQSTQSGRSELHHMEEIVVL